MLSFDIKVDVQAYLNEKVRAI